MRTMVFVALMLLFVGCGEKKSESAQETSGIEEVKDLSKIEASDGQSASSRNNASQFTAYTIEGERTVHIAPDGEENALTREIGAMVSIKNQYEQLSASLLRKRLSHNFIVKCSACHDDYANGIIGPSLLTKSSDDIFNRITAYKNGTKKNVLMKELVQKMSDSEIRALADEVAKFNKEVREKK